MGKVSVMLVLMLFYCVNLKAQCHAGFNYVINQSTKTVTFNNISTGSYSYIWKFGDLSQSAANSPSHAYTSYGNYTVCLIVQDSLKTCTDSICRVVPVLNPLSCNADFTFYTDTFNDRIIHYAPNNPGSNLNFFWTFGDSDSLAGKNVQHLFSTYGSYNTCLRVTKAFNGDTCNSTNCLPVNVLSSADLCHAIIKTTKDPLQKLALFESENVGPNLRYNWTFGDNSPAITTSSAYNYFYSTGKDYAVCLKITNVNDTSCHHTSCVNIRFDDTVSCNAAFTYKMDSINGQLNFTPQMSDTGNAAFLWSFGDNSYSVQSKAGHVFKSVGKYTVCLSSFKPIGTNGDSCISNHCEEIDLTKFVKNCTAAFSYEHDTSIKQGYAVLFNPQTPYLSDKGNYYVCLNVAGTVDTCNITNCQKIVVDRISGLKDEGFDFSDFKVYPNPFNKEISIDAGKWIGGSFEMELMNLDGSTCINKKFDAGAMPMSLNTANLEEGVYILKLSHSGFNHYQKMVKLN